MLNVADSGYPGSPISGLASYQSQVWPGPGQEMGQSIDLARRELADLIRDQGKPGNTSASLPSFPDIFSPQASVVTNYTHFSKIQTIRIMVQKALFDSYIRSFLKN